MPHLISSVLAFAGLLSLTTLYAAPGDLDRAFGDAGKVITDLGKEATVSAVAIQNDGKIIVAGTVDNSVDAYYGGWGFVLARYDDRGKLDAEFGNGTGKVITDFGLDFSASGRALALQSDGKIIVAGTGSRLK